MIRIPRRQLDAAIGAISECMDSVTDAQGLNILVPPRKRRSMEAAVCGLLTALCEGYVVPSDVYFITSGVQFPPNQEENAA